MRVTNQQKQERKSGFKCRGSIPATKTGEAGIEPEGDDMKIGMVGISSFYSISYGNALRVIEGVDFVSASHENYNEEWSKKNTGFTREEFKNRFGVKLYENATEMLEKEKLDIAIVCSLAHLRPEDAVLCIKKGIHTFIAKPMAVELDGARKILETARQSKVNVSTTSPALFDGAIREAYNKVKNGEIGEVLSARAFNQHGCMGGNFWMAPEFQKEYRLGPELSLGFYNSSLLCLFVGGKPARVYAEYANLNSKESPWMDSGKATVAFDNGKLGSMDIYFAVPCRRAPLWEIEVGGTKGILRTQQGICEGTLWDADGNASYFYRSQNPILQAEIESFINACRSGKKPDLNIEDAYTAFEVCIGWYESSQKHMPVSLPLK